MISERTHSGSKLALAWLLLSFALSAFGADLQWPSAIDVASGPGLRSLTTDVILFEDRTANLTADAVLRRDGWQPGTARALSRGFTPSTIWLAGALENQGAQTVTRWISVDPVRLEDVAFYVVDQDTNAATVRYRSGAGAPMASRPLDTVNTVFPITLGPGQQIRYLIGVRSRSSMSLSLHIWHPRDFQVEAQRSITAHMLLTGAMLAMAVFSAVLAVVWRDRVFVILTATVVSEVVYELAFEGYLYALLFNRGGDWIVRLPSIAGNISVALFSGLLYSFIGLDKFRVWRWSYRIMVPTLLTAACWTAFGDYRTSAAVAVHGTLLSNLVWIASVAHAYRSGVPNARLILIAFLPDCATLFIRLGVLAGFLSTNCSAGTAQIWDSIGVLVLLSMIVGGRSRQLLLEQRRAQRLLWTEREATQERLEKAVAARTRELRSALDKADDAIRAKSDFLARISHDLRTPLTSIIGFADLIQADGREDAERGRVIRRSANHMLGMVNDLIDYARGRDADTLSSLPVYTYALLDVVSQHGVALANRSANKFSLNVVGPLPPVVELDERRMHQVLGNLLDNAAKFTNHGKIQLTVSADRLDVMQRRWNLRFSVSDNGCGIASVDHQRIFEPFVRLGEHNHRPGIGLGLSIVKMWTDRMGATLIFDSMPGIGTTVVIELPVKEVDEAEIASPRMHESPDTLPIIDGGGKLVLLAEDTVEIRELLRGDLLSLGFDVEAYDDGASAVRRLMAMDRPVPALVLTDRVMPEASGHEVLSAARSCHPDVPVVLISAVPFCHVTRPDASDRFDAQLLKPISLTDLRNTIARLLNVQREHRVGPPVSRNLSLPSEALLAEARTLIELGAISDLLDWAEKVSRAAPRHVEFAATVKQLAKRGELRELQSILKSSGRAMRQRQSDALDSG
ncbi:TPA: response regulator [Burkholderia vietnamiensis]|uniref:hybrid sensor histidine kinase/response regulator n=1 Tax=Burkholderia vietnamiensis TaxID=60552 RepID=UPI001CB2448B|nr:7TM-DISM domain-containing protein [Burkholderia vietnamiensis]CAG9200470.1 Histidine kinase [Burkholderia vietnamiensis]HDR9058046.1 response regulator [Burkholderia vietnamiensis]HDR9157070.1 response regulator [Burkholderia vietnamiensis]